MSQPNQTDDRQVKAADVKTGDFTYDSKDGSPVEVTHVQPFTRRMTDFVLIVTVDGDGFEHAADDVIRLAGAAVLAEARARRDRATRIAAIRSFVDWLEDNPNVPLPDVPSMQHSMVIGTDERKRSVAATVAALLGAEPTEDAEGNLTIRKPIVRRDAYRDIDYVWHATVEPKSVEDVPPRGIQDGDPDAVPVDHEGHAPTKPARTHDTQVDPTFNPAYRVARCGQQSVHSPHVMEHGPDEPRNCPGRAA